MNIFKNNNITLRKLAEFKHPIIKKSKAARTKEIKI